MFHITDTNRMICPALDQYGLRACMSLSNIDLGWRTNPDTDFVAAGVRSLIAELDVAAREDRLIVFPQQVHAADVRLIEEESILPLRGHFSYVPDCDGLVTDRSDVVIASQYADCTPIVLVSKDRSVFGVVHSGWRGTLGRIASCAVRLIETTYGIAPNQLVAFIWPAIAKDDFEVSLDVGEQFLAEFAGPEASDAGRSASVLPSWMERRGEKYHIDTHCVNRLVLENLGVEVHLSGAYSTFSDLRFHSHRRDKERAGRMVLVVTKAESEESMSGLKALG
ncbi:MAG: polyphenol oxidase family protein [Bacillota bacterium]|nr:polyphenol oxidase family protein [Bacillota bacterium]